jgi:iron complex transport system substrate-binding protein
VRIVSLLASATEIVCALGAGEMLVGRSHECDNPDWVKRLPPCSSPAFEVSVSSREIDNEVRRRLRSGEPLYHVHGESIRELHPDLLITQVHCQVCAVTPNDVQRSGGLAVRQLALSATSLEEIFQSILRISQELGLEERGEALVRRERKRLDMAREKAAGFSRPTVIMLEETGARNWWKLRMATFCLGEKASTQPPFLPSSFAMPIRST